MFFLAGFICHITASFAFLIAILTRNWLSIYNVNGLTNGFVQRGIFYVCDVVSTNTVVQETLCVSILDAESGLIPSNRKRDGKRKRNRFVLENKYFVSICRFSTCIGINCNWLRWT